MTMKRVSMKDDDNTLKDIRLLVDRIRELVEHEDGWDAIAALINVLGMLILKGSKSPDHMAEGYEMVGTCLSEFLAANTRTDQETMN